MTTLTVGCGTPNRFRGAAYVLFLEDGHRDGEFRGDEAQPVNILIKHLRKFIGLINRRAIAAFSRLEPWP